MRIGTKSFLWDCLSSRLVSGFIHSLSFWSSPPLSRLWSSTTPSPSTPPCAPTVSGENLLIPFMIFYVFLYLLMQIVCWEEAPWITSLQLLLSSLMRGLGRHLGEISSSSWGKETKCPKYAGSIINTRREMRIDCVSYASWKPLNYLHMSFGQQGTLIRSPSEKCTGKGRGGLEVSRFAQQIWTPLSKFRRPPSTLQSASSSNVTEYVRNSFATANKEIFKLLTTGKSIIRFGKIHVKPTHQHLHSKPRHQ